MQMKVRKGVIPVLLLVSILLSANGVSSASAADSSVWGVKPGQSAQWLVMASSNTTNTWWNLTSWLPVSNYTVPIDSTVNLTTKNVVNNWYVVDISAGNLSLTDVPMSEISFNLYLGCFPFYGGLICPVNWDVQKENATNNPYNNFTVKESRVGDIEIITFEYLVGNEGTILAYDKATGLLINGYGAFGKFMIEVALVSTSIDVGLVQSDYQALGTTYIIVETATIMGAAALIIIFVLVSRRTKGSK